MASLHHVVYLDNWVDPPPLNFEHRLTKYDSTTPEQLPSRLRDATIAICSSARITRAGIEAASNLQLIACNSTGTDQVDKVALRERGITLCHVPAQNTDSVAEHAFALYYALRRRIMPLHELTMDGVSWGKGPAFRLFEGGPPRTNAEECLVVVGYGALGECCQVETRGDMVLTNV